MLKNRKTKIILLVILIISMLAFVGCSQESEFYIVDTVDGCFEVDTENQTIFDGEYTYGYLISGSAESYKIKIIYPNDAIFTWEHKETANTGSWGEDYDDVTYVTGDILVDVLSPEIPVPVNIGKVILVIFLLIIGIWNTASPKTAWYLAYGWRYKNAQPSTVAITVNRIAGVVAILIAIAVMFI